MKKLPKMFRLRKRRGVAKQPSTAKNSRVYAVGDIHGRLDLLQDMLKQVKKDLKSYTGKSQFVLLGDYIDRGPASAKILDLLITGDLPCDEVVCLRGNHEDAMLGFAHGDQSAKNWLQFGGVETLESYGLAVTKYLCSDDDPAPDVRKAMKKVVPKKHFQFLEELPFHHVNGDYLFVHAGVRPDIPLPAQQLEDMMWIREDFLKHKKPFERFIVHGHTISAEPDIQPNRIGIDTGAYKTGTLTCLVLEGKEQRFLSARC